MATSATSVSFSELLVRAKPRVLTQLAQQSPPYTVFFSISDGAQRAKVCHETAEDIDALWLKLASQARKLIKSAKISPSWFRVDWVTKREPINWETLNKRFQNTKRGYFRYGLALDPECKIAFLEQELNGNAMLYGGNKIHHVVINRQKFRAYTDSRFSPQTPLDFDKNSPVVVLSTEGIFLDPKTPPQLLYGPGRNAGRRVIEQLDDKSTYGLIDSSGKYLASQVKASGRFNYGWHCCFDRPINTYNTLRHTSSTYALTEAWEVTQDPGMKRAIDRALHHLTEKLIQRTQLPSGEKAAFLIEANGEIKLGGNAVCLLALTKYSELTGTTKYLELLEELAVGIQFMQNPVSGKFVHVLQYPELSVKEEFRIIYYDGEAAFGLMRLYGLTKDDRWLQTVEKAFDYFIENKHWQAHDHWLSYCVNELTLYRPQEKYYQFGIQNVSGYLDFVLDRITTFPTLLELMMAAERMVSRLKDQTAFSHLLKQLDLEKFYRALHTRAKYLLNGYYWPEYAMYFENPKRITGSFFIRHHAFRVRIDDVEHYLSGFIAYRKLLIEKPNNVSQSIEVEKTSTIPKNPHVESGGANGIKSPEEIRPIPVADNWNMENVLEATSGKWSSPPKPNWRSTGLCIFSPGMRPGNMVILRPENDKRFIHPTQIRNLRYTPQAIITDNPDYRSKNGTPILQVSEVRKAILDIGRYSRAQLQGKIIGITGSSGKTTSVAMLQHMLRPWGTIGRTEHNANLPLGISWNLASIPWSTKFTVLEMAIGNMQLNSSIARPDVAVITNIHPAHLEYHHNTEEIARKKSRIFSGMNPGSIAVINRDIDEWPIIVAEAQKFRLKIITFGEHPQSDFQLVRYTSQTRTATATHSGESFSFDTGAPGTHMAMNGIACLACIHALGLDYRISLPLLPLFAPLPGRGNLSRANLHGKQINLIDEAYNANPASMQAALNLIRDTPLENSDAKKILVLGDMLELGDKSQYYHETLAPYITQSGAHKVYLLGEQMKSLNPKLSENGIDCSFFTDSSALKDALTSAINQDDLLLFKGSHGSGLHLLVKEILEPESTT